MKRFILVSGYYRKNQMVIPIDHIEEVTVNPQGNTVITVFSNVERVIKYTVSETVQEIYEKLYWREDQ